MPYLGVLVDTVVEVEGGSLEKEGTDPRGRVMFCAGVEVVVVRVRGLRVSRVVRVACAACVCFILSFLSLCASVRMCVRV